jgi:hypothetical protein
VSWIDTSPKNRVNPERHFLDIGVEHGDGELHLDPNGLIHAAATLRFLDLRPRPEVKSVLSGHPAVTLRDTDLEINLTPRELTRLVCRSLMPEEFFALVARYGMAYNWHGDFYRGNTGAALQPVFKEGEHEYAEIMRAETVPPDEAWPSYSDLGAASDSAMRIDLVQHPAVVTGYWQVHDEAGHIVTAANFGSLSRGSLLANLQSLGEGREACLGPAEEATRQVLRAASSRPGK